ncbi:hypothetical protein D7X33_27285, partial [Butyricicoccus sp. 1XD8-22]
MTFGKREADTGGNYGYYTQPSIFQDGDTIYILNNKKIHYITPVDNYSTMHTRNISYDDKISYFLDITKHNGFYYAAGYYSEYDSQTLKNIRKLVILKSSDMTNFTIIKEHIVDVAIDEIYLRVYSNKLLITLSKGILKGNEYYYFDINTNTVIKENNWENNTMYAYKNDSNSGGSWKRNYFYDSVTGFMYILNGDYLAKQKYNEPLVQIGMFNLTFQGGIENIIPFKNDTNELTIVGIGTTGSRSSSSWDGTYEMNVFGSRIEINTVRENINLANNKTKLQVQYGESATNPKMTSSFFDEDGKQKIYYKTINKDLQKVLIRKGRAVEVKAKYPTGDILPLFNGRTDLKDTAIDKAVDIKAFGNMNMLKHKKLPTYTLSQGYLEDIIKNIILRNPAIKEEDLDFDSTGLTHPKQTFENQYPLDSIKEVVQYYPDVVFYYGPDGKWKLKRVNITDVIFDYNSDIITDLKLTEVGTYNVVRVTSNGLFRDSLTGEARDETTFFMGEEIHEATTAIHKTQAELDAYASRLLNVFKNGYFSIKFKLNNLHSYLEINDVITIDNIPKLGIDINNRWVIKNVKPNATNKFETDIEAISY